MARTEPFSAELQAQLRAFGRPCKIARNELLFHSGSVPSAVFQITQGLIRLSTSAESGKEAVLSVLGPGEWLGEMSLFLDEPRTHDARAVVDTEVLVVSKDRFRAVVDDNPAYLRELLQLMSQRYRAALQWIDRSIMLPFPVRLARRLLFEHAKLGLDGQGASGGARGQVHAPLADAEALRLSQQDLADMLGVSRQSINKQLGRWERQGLVRLSYGRVSLLDCAALDRLTESDLGETQ